MATLRVRYQTIEFGTTDIHIRSLRDNQEFSDDKGEAEALGISSASWPLFGIVWPSGEVLAQLMVDYAIGENALFSYLKDSKGTCEIHMGDARIQMEAQLAETGSQKFDILVLDAFSSDAIPVHLMTLEAFQLYTRHLRDADSVIAVNISNRFLDFRDLVTNIGSRHQLETRIVQQNELKDVRIPSTWAILQQRLGEPGHESTTDTLWTDSFSNLLDILR